MRTFVVERILEGKYIVKKDTWKTPQIFGKKSVSHLSVSNKVSIWGFVFKKTIENSLGGNKLWSCMASLRIRGKVFNEKFVQFKNINK